MTEFLRASTWLRAPPADGGACSSALFTTTIDPRWLQGRGAFGGLLAAGLLRSMAALISPGRAPRTLHVHYCASATAGPLQAEVTLEREGATMTTTSVRARQDGKLVTLASATFAQPTSKPDATARWRDAPMPEVPRPAAVLPMPIDSPKMPAFAQFFEYRFCIGARPYSASTLPARTGGWVRLRESSSIDAFTVAALIDSYPPAVLQRLDTARMSASVNLTVDFHLVSSSLPPDAQFLLAGSSRVGDGGTTDEQQDLFSEDGVLVASCRQLIVLL